MSKELHIYGKKITIESDVSPEYANKIASYVNSKFDDLKGASKPPFDMAILVTLNIADELFQEREVTERAVSILEKELFDN